MKTTLGHAMLIASLLVCGACSSNPSTPESQNASVDTSTVQPADATATEAPKSETVSGEVKEIQTGKDGYTAKIITADSVVYFATVSHANLKENAHQYRSLKVGEMIQVTGDSWKMGDENHLTVRALK